MAEKLLTLGERFGAHPSAVRTWPASDLRTIEAGLLMRAARAERAAAAAQRQG